MLRYADFGLTDIIPHFAGGRVAIFAIQFLTPRSDYWFMLDHTSMREYNVVSYLTVQMYSRCILHSGASVALARRKTQSGDRQLAAYMVGF